MSPVFSCNFAQARCFYILDHENYVNQHPVITLDFKNYGVCTDKKMPTEAVTSVITTPTSIIGSSSKVTHTTPTSDVQISNASPIVSAASLAMSTSSVTDTVTQFTSDVTVTLAATTTLASETSAGVEVNTTTTSTTSPMQTNSLYTTADTTSETSVTQNNQQDASLQSPLPTEAVSSVSTTTQSSITTTVITVHELMAQVFCQNRGYIDCSATFELVCGSNGQLYPNL